MPVTAEVDVEARVAELVAARRPVLAELVRQAVERELVALVDAELEAALERLAANNGARVSSSAELLTAALCSSCHERPRLAGRTVCQACRHARARERRAPASADDVPRPAQAN